MQVFKYYILITIVAGIACASCIRADIEELDFVEAVTDSVKVTGWGSVELKGTIEGLRTGVVQEHGFLLSTTNADPVLNATGITKINLGSTTLGGTFDTLLTNLSVAPNAYYARAYAIFGERVVYGNVRSFGFNMKVSLNENNYYNRNDTLIIQGFVIGLQLLNISLEEHGHLIFTTNGSFRDTSRLGRAGADQAFSSTFNALKFNSDYAVCAYIKTNNQYYYSDTLQIRTGGGWLEVKELEIGLGNAVAVSNDNGTRAYVGIGCEYELCDIQSVNKRWFEYAPDVNNGKGVWIEKKSFPGLSRIGTVAFAIGDIIYVGLGGIPLGDGSIQYYQDFWKFSPSGAGTWELMTDFPGVGRWDAVAFSLDGKGYVGTGSREDEGVYLYDFYEFDPQANAGKGNWIQIDSIPNCTLRGFCSDTDKEYFGRANAVAFTIQNKAYVGTGENFGIQYDDFWQYDNTSRKWKYSNSLNGEVRSSAVAFTIKNKGYVGTGIDQESNYLNDFWQFDPAKNKWERQTAFRGDGRWQGAGFSVAGKGYIGLGTLRLFTGSDFEKMTTDSWFSYTPINK